MLSLARLGFVSFLVALAWVATPAGAQDRMRGGAPSLAAPGEASQPIDPERGQGKQGATELAPRPGTSVPPTVPGRLGVERGPRDPGPGQLKAGDPGPGKRKGLVGRPGRGRPGALFGGGFMGNLQNCVPATNCYGGGDPCYLEISQGAPIVSLVGIDGGGGPVQQKAAYRIRLCTDDDDGVCEATSANQRLNYNVFHYADAADPYVLNLQLSTTSGTLDTGPYQELGPHDFFGVVCLEGEAPCRIAWQYCELPPNDPGGTK